MLRLLASRELGLILTLHKTYRGCEGFIWHGQPIGMLEMTKAEGRKESGWALKAVIWEAQVVSRSAQ